MALPWWKQFPFGNGAEIEANRKSDCERFLASKSDNASFGKISFSESALSKTLAITGSANFRRLSIF